MSKKTDANPANETAPADMFETTKEKPVRVFRSADAILDCEDRLPDTIYIKEWDSLIQYQEVDAAELANIAKASRDEEGERDWTEYGARVIIAGSLNPKFNLAQLQRLMKKSNRALTRLYNAIADGKKK